MSRPQKCRKVCTPPKMIGFKPYGMAACEQSPLKITMEEYESIKLIDYENLNQDQAAGLMNVSRPTFTRIYNKALKTLAKAIVEGKPFEIEGGNYQFDQQWFRCSKCFKLINGAENHTKCKNCKVFSDSELIDLNK